MESINATTSGVLITEVLLQTPPRLLVSLSSDDELNFTEAVPAKQAPQFRKTCLQVQIPSDLDKCHVTSCSLPINSPTARESRAFSHQAAINGSGINSPTREEKQQYPWLFQSTAMPEARPETYDNTIANSGKRKLMPMNTLSRDERRAITAIADQEQSNIGDGDNDHEEITIHLVSKSSVEEDNDSHLARKRLMAVSDLSNLERRAISNTWTPHHILGRQCTDHDGISMNILESME